MGSFFFEEGGNKSRRPKFGPFYLTRFLKFCQVVSGWCREREDTRTLIQGQKLLEETRSFLVAVLISHQVSLIEQPKTFVYRYLLVR